MLNKIRMIISILVCVFVISVALLPNSGANIVPQQELEFSESVTLRWQTEVKCEAQGAAYFRSTLDTDQDGVVTENELDTYENTLNTDSDLEWFMVNGEPATVSNAYNIDYSGALGDVRTGGDFTYYVDVELSWPNVRQNSPAYNLRLTNPEYVTKAETDMNVPDNWEVTDYQDFDYAEAPNGKSDFYGELSGGGSSGLVTIKKTDSDGEAEIPLFEFMLYVVTISSIMVIIMLIVFTLKKDKDQ